MKTLLSMLAASFVLLGGSLLRSDSPPAATEEVQRAPLVIYETGHDISLPIRDYPSFISPRMAPRVREEAEPRRVWPTIVDQGPDSVLQNLELSPLAPVSAVIGQNFDGLNINQNRFPGAPPDTNASVGATQVVETSNIIWQVFSKTGVSLHGPAEIGAIFTGAPGNCGAQVATGNSTDPVVIYDKAANRWVITISVFNASGSANDECIAVSTTPDATGTYVRYDFSFGSIFPDYQKIAAWPDAYYLGFNTFNPGSDACAFNRTAMLAGRTATGQCFQRGGNDFSFLPSDLDGSVPPPVGTPNFFLELSGTSFTKLNLFKFHVDFVVPGNSKFTGPTAITIPSWAPLCQGTRSCITQPSPGEKLDGIGDRLMFRLAYRKFVTHEALVATHSVKAGAAVTGARWYEIRNPRTTPTLFQSGTLSGGSTLSYWVPSVAMDKVGDIALAFSGSGKTVKPEVAFTGRVPTDSPGTMQGAKIVKAGTGVQTNTFNRWGDYSTIVIDPVDDCTFWIANEYYATTGSFNWRTRLASVKFPTCR